MRIEELKEMYSYNDIYSLYIVENTPQKEAPNILNISSKDFRRLLSFYGIKKDPKLASKNNTYKRSHEESLIIGKKSAETQKKHWEEKSNEEKGNWTNYCREIQLNLPNEKRSEMTLKMLKTNSLKSVEQLKTENEKRSKSCKAAWEKPETHIKYKNTFNANRRLRNESPFRSKIEKEVYNKLYAVYPDVLYDYIDEERYPFNCDFYIPSLDLFIEIQGHPSHGVRPYAENNNERITGKWYEVYAIKDVEKYNIAVKNKINLIRIYPSVTLTENYNINNNEFVDIINLILNRSD